MPEKKIEKKEEARVFTRQIRKTRPRHGFEIVLLTIAFFAFLGTMLLARNGVTFLLSLGGIVCVCMPVVILFDEEEDYWQTLVIRETPGDIKKKKPGEG